MNNLKTLVMNFSFGARAAPTSNSCLVDIYHGWNEVSDQVDAAGYREVQSGEHQDPGALCRPPGQGEGVWTCYKNIQKRNLSTHMKKFHSRFQQTQYNCKICMFQSIHSNSLYTHVKNVHKKIQRNK